MQYPTRMCFFRIWMLIPRGAAPPKNPRPNTTACGISSAYTNEHKKRSRDAASFFCMCSVPRPFLPLSRADCSGTGIQRPARVIGRERISAGFIHRDRLTVHRHVVSVVVSDREFSIAVVGSAVFNPRNRAGRRIVHGERKHAGQNLRARCCSCRKTARNRRLR